jgi:hypothetical protein
MNVHFDYALAEAFRPDNRNFYFAPSVGRVAFVGPPIHMGPRFYNVLMEIQDDPGTDPYHLECFCVFGVRLRYDGGAVCRDFLRDIHNP